MQSIVKHEHLFCSLQKRGSRYIPVFYFMNPSFAKFRERVIHPLKFRLFLLQQLPSAWVAGLRIQSFSEQQAIITVRYKWFNKNPFRSMYFAVQSMAAEMSTGLLASAQIYQRHPKISMLVTGLEAKFVKKVTGIVCFTCEDGNKISAIVDEAIATGESRTIACKSTGTDIAGEVVSEFWITWSFKCKVH